MVKSCLGIQLCSLSVFIFAKDRRDPAQPQVFLHSLYKSLLIKCNKTWFMLQGFLSQLSQSVDQKTDSQQVESGRTNGQLTTGSLQGLGTVWDISRHGQKQTLKRFTWKHLQHFAVSVMRSCPSQCFYCCVLVLGI